MTKTTTIKTIPEGATCVRKVARRFETLLAEYRPSLIQRDPYRIVEWKKVERREGGAALVWTQRMTPSSGVFVADGEEYLRDLKLARRGRRGFVLSGPAEDLAPEPEPCWPFTPGVTRDDLR